MTLPNFSQADCEISERKVVHQGLFRYVHYYLRHRLFKGGWTPILKRELLERLQAAGLLPYDPILDQVVLISQFRPGAMSTETMKTSLTNKHSGPWLIEIIAGVLDTEEKPAEVAVREADEEAGCEILDLYPVTEFFVSPGGSNEYFHLFCGRIDASKAGGTFGLEKDHEDIYAFPLPAEEAFEWLHQGKITTAPAIIALQWLQINRNFLRDFWLKKS